MNSKTLEKPEKSVRSTKQRLAIRHSFEKSGRPLSPKEILDVAGLEVEKLGIATVYRNIKSMLEKKELIAVDIPGQPSRYFLPSGAKRPVFLCTKTNMAFFVDPKCIKIELANLPKEFHPDHSEVVIFGRYEKGHHQHGSHCSTGCTH